jgi:hypothetical protein
VVLFFDRSIECSNGATNVPLKTPNGLSISRLPAAKTFPNHVGKRPSKFCAALLDFQLNQDDGSP